MVSIVKKGTNPSCFNLKSGKKIIFEPDILNVLSDDDFEELMNEYGSFIKERIISDKNPRGCFIVNAKAESAKAEQKEIGDEIKDRSAPIEVKEPEIKKTSKKSKK